MVDSTTAQPTAPEELRGFITPEAAKTLFAPNSREQFKKNGILVLEDGLQPAVCRQIIDSLAGASMIEVPTQNDRGHTYFLTLNGKELVARAEALGEMYETFASVAECLADKSMSPLESYDIGLSLNYTPEGGGFVRHFDRNALTVSLYLNNVDGGQLIVWPKILSPLLRIFGEKGKSIAIRLSRFFRGIEIAPRTGTIAVFTDSAAHAVNPVRGNKARVSVIMAYDAPGKTYAHESNYYGRANARVVLQTVNA